MTPVLRKMELHDREVWTWFDKNGHEHGPYVSKMRARQAAVKRHSEEAITKSLHKKLAKENNMTQEQLEKKLREAKAWENT